MTILLILSVITLMLSSLDVSRFLFPDIHFLGSPDFHRYLAAAVHAPVSVLETAGEGGPWGMAILALYMVDKAEGETLEEYLDKKIFSGMESDTVEPDEKDIEGFEQFTARYSDNIGIMKAAVKSLKS